MFRQELYRAIRRTILAEVPEVRHIDLWNRNVEFAEEDTPWQTPALFVEFAPVTWSPFKNGFLRGAGQVILHIVTRWQGETATRLPGSEELSDQPDTAVADHSPFRLSDAVLRALDGMEGYGFSCLAPMETRTCHDHEELVESIEVMAVRFLREM